MKYMSSISTNHKDTSLSTGTRVTKKSSNFIFNAFDVLVLWKSLRGYRYNIGYIFVQRFGVQIAGNENTAKSVLKICVTVCVSETDPWADGGSHWDSYTKFAMTNGVMYLWKHICSWYITEVLWHIGGMISNRTWFLLNVGHLMPGLLCVMDLFHYFSK